MRGRAFIIASIALNLALAAALWLEREGRVVPKAAQTRLIRSVVTNAPRTHIVIRKENFNWSELESEDYASYIENLRSIGCPPETIRDIIVADVNGIYARKRATLAPDDIEWWKASPQQQAAQSLLRKERELDTERRELLTTLLGAGWDKATNLAQPAPFVLTGPVLGALPDQTKRAVLDILARQTEQFRATNDAGESSLTPLAEARLRERTRAELAKVLNAEQLEEFLLRWSRNATELRGRLANAEVTPEEFRKLFRTLDPIEQKLQLEVTGDDATSKATRESLEKQREEALQQALGPERYRAMKLQQDPLFAQARETAEKINAPADTVMPIYELNRATEAELQRIRADQTLTFDEREDALAAAELERQRALRQMLGEQAWLKFKGGATNPPAN